VSIRARSRTLAGGRLEAAAILVLTLPLSGAIATGHFRPAQETPIWTTIEPADWGLEDLARIQRGQIGLIDAPDGLQLAVYRLSDLPQPVFRGGVRSEAPTFSDGSFVVAEFSDGIRNQLNGFFNGFEQAPSRARASLAAAPDGRRGLRLSYAREERGFCGVWVHLFDGTRPPDERVYLDARTASTLSFWVRGAQGGERVLLKLADERWERLGDAVDLGELGDFLPSGQVEAEWQQAVVRLDSLPDGIAIGRLASVVLEGIAPARAEVFVSRLALSQAPQRPPPLPDPSPAPGLGGASSRATWIWNTAELLDDPGRRDGLLRFLASREIDTAFLQLVSAPGETLPEGEIDPDPRIRRLIARLHELGIETYALDGYKRYALPQYHPAVLSTIRNVARYNAESDEAERFVGVRYDIEPYLLPGFHGPRRAWILSGYLAILARGSDVARESGLRFGADIPFWYDAPDEVAFQKVTADFRGRERPVSEHVIDLVDDIAIMDYRTVAYGADGIIRHAQGELEYATQVGKRAYVALETGELPDETLIEFGGEPVWGTPLDPPAERGLVGLATAGDSALVIWQPARPAADFSSSEPMLTELLSRFGAEPADVSWWPVTRRIAVPGDKLSFASLGPQPLQQAMDETARELSRQQSFAGFAFHYSESYRALLEDGSP